MSSRKQRYIIFLSGAILLIALAGWLLLPKEKEISLRDYPEIQQEGVLRIVTEYKPNQYYVSGDTIAGLQYELIKEIERQSGWKVEVYLENNLEKSITGLLANQYDIIARNIPVTEEYKEQLAFTKPIAQNRQVLVQRKAADNDSLFVNNQLQLANKTIHIPQNSPNKLRLHNLSEEIAEPIYLQEVADYSVEQLMYMVASGDIDYTVADRSLVQRIAKDFPQLDFQTEISFTQFQAWALRKTSPVLLDSINSWK